MTYSTITTHYDSSCGIKRLEFFHSNRKVDLCLPSVADEHEIQEVISEILTLNPNLARGLMTQAALCMYMNAPQSVFDAMSALEIGESFEYAGVKITRVSKLTYNGRIIHKVAVSF